MSTQRLSVYFVPCLASYLLAVPSPAIAASGGRTIEEVFTAFLAVSALLLLIWAAYFFSPVRRHLIQRRIHYRRMLLIPLGVISLAFGVVSLYTGKSTLGQGGTALLAVEPQRFWQHVGLQLGAGSLLIVIGLLNRPRNK